MSYNHTLDPSKFIYVVTDDGKIYLDFDQKLARHFQVDFFMRYVKRRMAMFGTKRHFEEEIYFRYSDDFSELDSKELIGISALVHSQYASPEVMTTKHRIRKVGYDTLEKILAIKESIENQPQHSF